MDTLDEVREILKKIGISQAEAAEQHNRDMAELRRSQEKTDVQLAKTDAQLEKVAKILGNIGISNGDFAEELFYNSLYANPFLGGLRYDSVERNVPNRRRHRDEGEYDIVMYNGDTVALIEVKYKAHTNDIAKLLKNEPQNFRQTFTEYKDYKFYLGLASTVTYDKLITEAREAGIFLLPQRGQHIEVVNEEVHSF